MDLGTPPNALRTVSTLLSSSPHGETGLHGRLHEAKVTAKVRPSGILGHLVPYLIVQEGQVAREDFAMATPSSVCRRVGVVGPEMCPSRLVPPSVRVV